MKKLLASSIIASALIAVPTFAAEEAKIEIMPISAPIEVTTDTAQDKYKTIIQNNNISSDYEYNNSHYFSSKITTTNIVIPKEVKDKAEKIYFLVEQGRNYPILALEKWAYADLSVEDVKEEYNYKKVDFSENKTEYVFNNADLVEDFGEDKHHNFTITLVAEFEDEKQMPLSNSTYISIASKENILSYLSEKDNGETGYYRYYNASELETYLEKMSEKMTRSEYKNMLSKADSKIEKALRENTKNKDNILKKITKESHFGNYISDYQTYTEVSRLMSTLNTAVKNQLQNIRAFDAIDRILK